ncbi:hypothetical protein [Streptomyces sp. sk226]|uniref:hypothetical protein n=1 Tax=Streptomyces sp. sk226 TaxID=2034268 RepID=UPI001184DF4C|nr:hypothetical protein [Streptomyces sp. sk226]
MKRIAKRTPWPSTRLGRWCTTTMAHLRKWAAGPGRSVQISFMNGAATKLGEFATTVVIAWLIYRR